MVTYWHPGFWSGQLGKGGLDEGHMGLLERMPRGTTYTALGWSDGVDGIDEPLEAVGLAALMFRDWYRKPAWVTVSTRRENHPLNEEKVYIVAATKDEIDKILHDDLAERERERGRRNPPRSRRR